MSILRRDDKVEQKSTPMINGCSTLRRNHSFLSCSTSAAMKMDDAAPMPTVGSSDAIESPLSLFVVRPIRGTDLPQVRGYSSYVNLPSLRACVCVCVCRFSVELPILLAILVVVVVVVVVLVVVCML